MQGLLFLCALVCVALVKLELAEKYMIIFYIFSWSKLSLQFRSCAVPAITCSFAAVWRNTADALGHVAESFNNRLVCELLARVRQQVQTGKPFTHAIQACPVLAIPEIKTCLAIAHETAELEVILQRSRIVSRTRALKNLNRLTLFIRPVFLLFLGAAIGGVLLALYLPLV